MAIINTEEDFLRALSENPQWREAVRARILGDELLQLPVQFAAFVAEQTRFNQEVKADITELKADITELKTDVAEIKTRVTGLEDGLANVTVIVTGMQGRLGNLSGFYYENTVGKAIHGLAHRYLSLRRTRAIYSVRIGSNHEFVNLLNDAEDNGAISSEELDELLNLDLVLTARRPSDNADIHVAAEISVTADQEDVQRAARRGQMLTKVVNQPVMPVVVSANVGDTLPRFADESGVTVIVQPEG